MNDGQGHHFRALEALYASAPINRLFPSRLIVEREGATRIESSVDPGHFHGAGAAHGAVYFKLLDDAAFFAAASLVTDVFVLTANFTLLLTRPLPAGALVAEGRWLNGRRRTLFAESRLYGPDGEEVARGSGTFMRSRIRLADLPNYAAG